MKSIFEWVREGNPDYVKNKKKKELEAEMAGFQERLDHLTTMRGEGAIQRDMRDPEDARLIDRLEGDIERVKKELAELEGSNS